MCPFRKSLKSAKSLYPTMYTATKFRCTLLYSLCLKVRTKSKWIPKILIYLYKKNSVPKFCKLLLKGTVS